MDDEVEYVSDDEDYAPRPRSNVNNRPEMDLYSIDSQFPFYKFNGTQLFGPVDFTLKGFEPTQSIYAFSDANNESYILTGKTITGKEPIFQGESLKPYNLHNDVIVWQRLNTTEYYLSSKIVYDFIDGTNQNYNFFIDQHDYLLEGKSSQGVISSLANIKLTVETKKHRDDGEENVYYTFSNHDSSTIYNFERNENNKFQLIISDTENSERIYDVKSDTSKCTTTAPCIDDISETLDEEEDSDDIDACTSCGDYYHIGDNDKPDEHKGLCAPCIISLQISDINGIVYKPIQKTSFYSFDKLSTKTHGLNSRPKIAGPKLIITMFSFLSGHGMVVNKEFRGKINTIIANGSQLYGTPGWTATELVETSTFRPGTQCQGNYTCKTHIICIGNPLLPTITTELNNGALTNNVFDQLCDADSSVDESVKQLLQFQNSTHSMSLNKIKKFVIDKRNDKKTNDLIVANYYRAQQIGELWGISSNIGSNEEIKTAEKYIGGYKDAIEMADRIQNKLDLDEAVNVNHPIVRAKFCNVYCENAQGIVVANKNFMINHLFMLPNGIKLSDVNRNCEKYLCESVYSHLSQTNTNVRAAIAQNSHIELVSIILDNTCNYAGSGVVLSHSGVVPYGFKQTESPYVTVNTQPQAQQVSPFSPFGQQQASPFSPFGQQQASPFSPFGQQPQQPFSLFGRRGGFKKTKGKVYKNTRNHRKASKKQRKIRTRRNNRKTRK